jgi:hypothetical protein
VVLSRRLLFHARWALLSVAVGLAAAHVVAIHTESINWDEFATFSRAAESIRTGVLQSGGRPGLATVLAIPLVRDCQDAVEVVRAGRLFTAAATLALLVGVFLLLQRTIHADREDAWMRAALGVASLVCVPVFLRWSLQVRTDQWALACGVWAGVALLASRRRVCLAVVSGLLFGCAWLFSQKALYVGALVLLLCAGRQFVIAEFVLRRELLRAVLVLAGAAFAQMGFLALLDRAFERPTQASIDGAFDVFAFYRQVLGFRVYRGIARTLAPHFLVIVMFGLATFAPACRARWREAALGWAVIFLGTIVGVFHAAAFPYFWMTLGLFSAAAFAIALGPIGALFTSPLLRSAVVGLLWATLVIPAAFVSSRLLSDSQRSQRDALAFVDRNFELSARGFQPEQALFCRRDPSPFPVFFSQHIRQRLTSAEAQTAFIAEFVARPVAFIVTSHRLGQFPRRIRDFWRNHYVPYGFAVWVPGFDLGGDLPIERPIDVIVDGEYRWFAHPPTIRAEVRGQVLGPGETLFLKRGRYQLRGQGPLQSGTLVYALSEPPAMQQSRFYGADMLREFDHGW